MVAELPLRLRRQLLMFLQESLAPQAKRIVERCYVLIVLALPILIMEVGLTRREHLLRRLLEHLLRRLLLV